MFLEVTIAEATNWVDVLILLGVIVLLVVTFWRGRA